MAVSEHLNITLKVAGRSYLVKVRRKDEEIFRNAAKDIDRKINQYKNYFSGKDQKELEEIDSVIMTTIQAVSEHVDLDTKNKAFENKIKSLTEELDKYLSR